MYKYLVLALFAGSAYAAPSSNPEYLHQAPGGALELTPKLSYASAKAKYKGGTSADIKGFREALRFEGGFTEMLSGGLELAANTLKTDFSDPAKKDTSQTGLEDLVLYLRARSDMAGGSLRYGLDIDLALAKEKIESNGDSNNSSGGIALAPFIGFETAVGQGNLGGRLEYKFLVTDANGESTNASGDTTSFKTSGGAVLQPAVFYEMPMNMVTLGVAYEMLFTDKRKVDVNGTKSDRTASNTQWDLMVYVPVDVTPTIRILPQLKYVQYSAFDTAAADSLDGFDFTVGARFAF